MFSLPGPHNFPLFHTELPEATWMFSQPLFPSVEALQIVGREFGPGYIEQHNVILLFL